MQQAGLAFSSLLAATFLSCEFDRGLVVENTGFEPSALQGACRPKFEHQRQPCSSLFELASGALCSFFCECFKEEHQQTEASAKSQQALGAQLLCMHLLRLVICTT